MKKSDNNRVDVAVCFETVQNQLCAAVYDARAERCIERFIVRETTYHELRSWCERLGYNPQTEIVFRFVPDLFTEQTHVAALAGDVLAFDEARLIEWLFQAADKSGEDGNPVFETSFERAAYDFTRLPNGLVSLTELPRESLELARRNFIRIATPITTDELEAAVFKNTPLPDFPQAVETRLRTVTRFLAEEEREFFTGLAPDETVGVFAFTPEGVGFALWNPSYGFYSEIGDTFHFDMDEQAVPDGMEKGEFIGQLYGESVYSFLNDQFYRRIVPDDESVAPVNLKRVYWTATANLIKPLEHLVGEFTRQTEFPFVYMPTPMEEMVVGGLLLGTVEATTELVASVNLANDLELQYHSLQAAAAERQNQKLRAGRRLATIYLLMPVACALGLVIGLLINNMRIAASLEIRRSSAAAAKEKLQPLLTARTEYEKTRIWYEDVLRQIVGLRKKQTAALMFAAHLDPLFPQTDSFYISDLRLLPGGNFEIKGLARDQFAVAEFARQVEFATDDAKKNYFGALTLDFKQGSQVEKSSGANGSAGNVPVNLPPGVSGFFIKGNFAPAAVLKAQEAKPLQPAAGAPGVQNQSANTSAPKNAAPGAPATANSNGTNSNGAK